MATRILPRHWFLILFGIIFAGYIFFQARFIIFGPSVYIEFPADGATVSESVVTISGQAVNAAWISLNGEQIFTDEDGHWSETLPLSPGVSIMSVRVRDRFGRETEDRITITYTP